MNNPSFSETYLEHSDLKSLEHVSVNLDPKLLELSDTLN